MNLLIIFLVVGLGFTIYLKIKKLELNKVAVGRRVFLTYADQNDWIKDELPRTGTIERMLRIGNKSDNFLISLDEPIFFNNSSFSQVVVRERILGSYIGSSKETDVHLLLPKHVPMGDKEQWDSFDHSAWLTIRLQ